MASVAVWSEKNTLNPAIAGQTFLAHVYWSGVPSFFTGERPSVIAKCELWYNMSQSEAEEWVLQNTATSRQIFGGAGTYNPRMYPPIVEPPGFIGAKLVGIIKYLQHSAVGWAEVTSAPHYLTVDNT